LLHVVQAERAALDRILAGGITLRMRPGVLGPRCDDRDVEEQRRGSGGDRHSHVDESWHTVPVPYPVSITIEPRYRNRDRLTVGFRIILAIPHFIVLFFVLFAWWVTSIVSWIIILVTTEYPQGLYDFGVGAFGWLIRVEAYVLLLVDEYPPFSLE